jgi:hypothetical protein
MHTRADAKNGFCPPCPKRTGIHPAATRGKKRLDHDRPEVIHSGACRPGDNQIAQGRIYLESGDFLRAREVFQALYDKGQTASEIVQGLGEAKAGEAGFQVLSVLDLIQNTAAGTLDDLDTMWRQIETGV